jgi:hypothetical protein
MGDHPIATQVLDPVAAKMLLSLDLWAWWGVTELKLLAYANDQHPHRFRTDIWANAGCAADHGALLDLPLNLGPAWIRIHGSMAASVYVYLGHRWSPVIARDAEGGPLDLRSDVPTWNREATRAAYRILCPTESEAEAQRWLDRMRDGQWWGGKWDQWAV